MKMSCLKEYPAYWAVRFLSRLVRFMPLPLNYGLACLAAGAMYCLAKKKRRLVLKNLKAVFPEKGYQELGRIARGAFKNLALNIIEVLYLPRMDEGYIKEHVRVENIGRISEALKKGRGVIMLAYHFGNWEVANVACAFQGHEYKVVVNEQRYPLLNGLLNKWRQSKGAKAIPRGMAIREIIKALRNNEVVAMVGDQGGSEGRLVNFFGLPTSMPEGAVRFALNSDTPVIPSLIIREKAFHHRIILEEPLKVERAADDDTAVERALLNSSAVLESYVKKYPREYFWFYKIWKHSPQKSILVITDGKAGHLRQAQAVARIVHSSQLTVDSKSIEIKFKNRAAKFIANVFAILNINVLRICLEEESYRDLKNARADIVVSCGSSAAGVSLIAARENLAKAVCVMKPPAFLSGRFNLIIAPRHDNPAAKKNTFITEGALNLIDDEYLSRNTEKLKAHLVSKGVYFDGAANQKITLGLLIGGDTGKHKLAPGLISEVLGGLKRACADYGARLLVTTSRRTPRNIEVLLKKELGSYDKCPLLVIANEKNLPEALGGILGLSDIVIVSSESISMVSEAASAGKYTVAFLLDDGPARPSHKHEAFLKNLEGKGFIYIAKAAAIADKIRDILERKPEIKRLDDGSLLKDAVRRIL